MCELLELCFPLCICVFRSCQFGLLGIMCIFNCIDECCIRPCCPNSCKKKQKAVSQEDVREDMVDSGWGEPQSKVIKPSRSSYGHMEIPPFRGHKPNMDQGWDDSPSNKTRIIEPGWDSTPLNLEQPCSDERLSSSATNISVYFDSLLMLRKFIWNTSCTWFCLVYLIDDYLGTS